MVCLAGPGAVLLAREAGPPPAVDQGWTEAEAYGGVNSASGSSAEAAPAIASTAPNVRITAATVLAIVFDFIEGAPSLGGGRG